MAILHAEDGHWTVNPYDYHYDMTVYAVLVDDGNVVTDYSQKEVAAFIGDECRAVAQVQSKNGYTWLCFRVRSNVASGETIVFHVYDKVTKEESMKFQTHPLMVFQADDVIGLPSKPVELSNAAIPGDVNSDGTIDVADVNAVISVICGTSVNPFADVNGDNTVDVADVNAVISIICGS